MVSYEQVTCKPRIPNGVSYIIVCFIRIINQLILIMYNSMKQLSYFKITYYYDLYLTFNLNITRQVLLRFVLACHSIKYAKAVRTTKDFSEIIA